MNTQADKAVADSAAQVSKTAAQASIAAAKVAAAAKYDQLKGEAQDKIADASETLKAQTAQTQQQLQDFARRTKDKTADILDNLADKLRQ